MHQPEDIDIVRRVTAGEQAAYALLVHRYQHMVFTLALRFTGNREDAEEIAQDVFIKAYRNLGDYKGTGKFSTWLYTITKTTSFSALRSKRGKPEVVSQETVGGRVEPMSGEKPGALSEQRSRDTLLREAIACLQESDAEILTLFYHGEQKPGGNRADIGSEQ